MRQHLLFAGLVALAVLASSCDESLSKLAGPSPNLQPSFASIQREIFETTDTAGRTSCVTCHTNNNGRTPSGGMNLNADVSYDQLVNVTSRSRPGATRVIPGNPDTSYIIQKLTKSTGDPSIVGRRMPFNGPPYLSDGQVLIVRRWIEIGAPRN